MSDRKRILISFVLIMTGGMFSASAIAIMILYRTAFEQERRYLMEIARGQARLVEAVARFDAAHSYTDDPNRATRATLSPIADAHQQRPGFGETGEFVIARRDGDQIVFLLPYRHGDGADPDSVPWGSELAEPMRRALSGKAGALIGLDYRGERVLAVHEPAAALNLGVVAKIDLAEVRAPFVTAGAVAGGVTALLVLVGAGLTLRVTDPLVRKLQESKARYARLSHQNKMVLDSAGEGVYGLDLQGNTTFINPAAARMLGWQVEELIGQPQHDVLHHTKSDGTPYPREECPIYAAFRDGAAHHVDNEVFWRKDGTSFPVEYVSTPIQEGGTPVGAVVVFRDISRRKKAEQEREKLIELLKESNATLDHLNERLAQSNRELQDFAYVASHDLQEPLRKVRAFGERLKVKYDDALDDQGHDYIGRMQSAAERMQTLIDDLLSFSRIASKAQPFTHVELSKVVEGVVSDLETRIEELGARVELSDLPTIDADPLQMRQLLQNLIGNALKFHRDGEPPVVKVCGHLVDGAGGGSAGMSLADQLCQITVEDNGIGFEQKHADRIFGFFQRLHGRGTYAGTGIGLAICRRIVERHGGSITAESAPGQGAKFIVTLPVEQHKGEREPCHTSDSQSRS